MTNNNIKNVVMLCSKKIGLECLKILFLEQQSMSFNIVGVLTNERGDEIIDFCNANNLRIIHSLEEYRSIRDIDIAISVQYHKILKQESNVTSA